MMITKATGVYNKIQMQIEVNMEHEIVEKKNKEVSEDDEDDEAFDEDKAINNCKCCGIQCGKITKCCLKSPLIKSICCCFKLKPKSKKPKFNLNFLLCLTIVCACSGMQIATAMVNQIPMNQYIMTQLYPNKKDQSKFNVNLLSHCPTVGMAIGAVLGGKALQHGRRNWLVIFNVVGIIASVLSVISN